MSKLEVESWNEHKDGPLSAENMRRKLESEGYTCAEYNFGPGTDFPDHTHSFTKKDAILSGQFVFGMYGETVTLQPGDMIVVPKGVVHHAHVKGNQPVVFFDASK